MFENKLFLIKFKLKSLLELEKLYGLTHLLLPDAAGSHKVLSVVKLLNKAGCIFRLNGVEATAAPVLLHGVKESTNPYVGQGQCGQKHYSLSSSYSVPLSDHFLSW